MVLNINVLILLAENKTKHIWIYEMEAVNYSLSTYAGYKIIVLSHTQDIKL